jgi:pyruvate dehydrogenase E2 component (dihydrolipoamide acetyltransferase)
VTVAADHRATDGVTGSRFLDALTRALEHPEEL